MSEAGAETATAAPDSAPRDELPPSAEHELLDTIARQARGVQLPVLLTSATIAGIAYGNVPGALIALWLTVVIAVAVARYLTLPHLPARADVPPADRLRVVANLNLVSGVLHGSAALAFPVLDEVARAAVTMILVGLSSGSVATSAGHRQLFMSFALPVLSIPAVMWVVSGSGALSPITHVAVAALIGFLFVILGRLARDTQAAFRETFEIRRREVALRRDLVVLNGRLSKALDAAQTANRAKTRFLASASHDLRQPLHALLLFSAALSVRKLDPKSQEIADRIDDATQDLAHELDTLLDVSKLDAGVVRVNIERVDVGAIAARIVDSMMPLAERKGLALAVSVQPGLDAASDRTLVERVLRNLVDNAIKYTDAGQVRVEGLRRPDSIAVRVIDSGRGIPPDEQERVFEEFYQIGNAERDRHKGLGLGLAIVRRLVDLLGGSLRLESTPGRGSTFEVVLPIDRREVPPDAHVDAPMHADIGGCHVLVVDDEPNVRDGMRLLLEGLGCRVSLAAGTADAVAGAAAARPDIVLADLRMQGDDSGVRTIDSVRSLYPGLPALLVSGDTAPDRLREAEHAGLALLHKPVPADVLTRAIASALARAPLQA
jgi:signal transduction histidine kinase/ActR/RegA family two-component response regulator